MNLKKKHVLIASIICIIAIAIITILIIILNDKSTKEEDIFATKEPQEEDLTAPIILLDDIYIVKTGYDKELVNAIMSVDDIDSNPTREIIGDYDLNTAGEYDVTYKITDSSGNVTTKDFVLKVVDDYEYESNEEDITFEEAVDLYKTEETKLGIDVSKWQGEINWEEVKEDGVEFAIIRVAYQNGFDGDIIEDPYFKQNIEGCAENEIPVSVYFSSYAKTVEEAEKQATWVCNLLANYNYAKLNIAFDWENWSSFNSLCLSLNELNNIADTFMNTCINLNYKTRLYSSKTYLEKVWTNSNNFSVWLANYVSQTNYSGEYVIWQFCQTGIVNGISGYVDINVAY